MCVAIAYIIIYFIFGIRINERKIDHQTCYSRISDVKAKDILMDSTIDMHILSQRIFLIKKAL